MNAELVSTLGALASAELDMAIDAWAHHNQAGYRIHLTHSDAAYARIKAIKQEDRLAVAIANVRSAS